MTDHVDALIAEARSASGGRFYGPISDDPKVLDLIDGLADALEAATVAPAVDREALVNFLRQDENFTHDPEGDGWVFSAEMAAIGLLASGIFRDVRDVQAEALEQAAEHLYDAGEIADEGYVKRWFMARARDLRARAQAIREAHNER